MTVNKLASREGVGYLTFSYGDEPQLPFPSIYPVCSEATNAIVADQPTVLGPSGSPNCFDNIAVPLVDAAIQQGIVDPSQREAFIDEVKIKPRQIVNVGSLVGRPAIVQRGKFSNHHNTSVDILVEKWL